MSNHLVCVGAVTGSFGVRGEARVKSFCAEPSSIANYGPLTSEDGAAAYTITLIRPVKGGFAARLGGIKTKEQADDIKGVRLYAPRDALPKLPDDEFYHADLIGLEVFDTGGNKLGRINAVHDHGGGDLLEIIGPNINGAQLVSFTGATVPTVDIAANRVIVDLPDQSADD